MPTNKDWNYHPDLPLQDPSIFSRPTDAKFLSGWFARNWLTLSERVLMLILAVAAYYTLYPSLASAQSFAPGWMLQILIANYILVIAVAGGLHWYFYIKRGQGKDLKFDHRDQTRNNRNFKFSDQVKDNMFWTLASGVPQLSAFQIVTYWLMANGYAPTITFASNPIWFVLAIILLPIWSAFHFYWVHRFLHVPFMYTRFHALHHRNINIGPWSGFSMHPVEHLLYLSTLCIHWIVASHPIHVIYHVIYQGPGAAMTHTGYEDLLVKDKRKLALGTFYHTLHHRYFECNYGNQEMPWDRWFGTFHDGTAEGTAETRARKKRMYS
ncbi:Sterol desaturase/sphingolipid hydroxylase, fatty acid hydroxylase superfamily [Cognatiyoonia sediminum]|uniref:Sterol desaturase/sphingolipid hydroxylase, fatty acid hydroxylase superfamily n=1 Tax=Cognatiyoonia sediminum TaxID=1508389 RepID=A0A1M5Q785_9RHOB|nr:sterol desaturase family protein [Cognatiyoonia sediminum]SHH09780.1 Sterol desaturase/sphingolipid hydroxylase, fatty acid hydroxylase superfamily [Cognatiyoonia sediminum]